MGEHQKIGIVLTILVVLVLNFSAASADEVWLKNGDHISGKVLNLKDNILTFSTPYAGDVSIKWDEVERLKTDTAVNLILSKDTSVIGIISPDEKGQVKVTSAELKAPVTVELANLKMINPPPPEPALKTKVNLAFGSTFTSGNTDTESIYGDGELVARTEKNRFTLGARYNYAKNDDVKAADNLLGYMKYDYFLSQKWYLYANAAGEKDDFKDINLRTSVGLGAGYQIFETELRNLSLELGASYVNEDFIVSEDKDYPAGRWGVRFDHYFLDKTLQFFLDNNGLQSFKESDDLLVYTRTGIRIPFYKQFNMTLQFNWDYNKNPSPGLKKSDEAYILAIGYQWGD
jgi:putative salt-induced outer membrane protein YdiY